MVLLPSNVLNEASTNPAAVNLMQAACSTDSMTMGQVFVVLALCGISILVAGGVLWYVVQATRPSRKDLVETVNVLSDPETMAAVKEGVEDK